MIIHYYSGATLPSHAAKSVHIMKMCEAWGRAGHTVTLFAKGKAQADIFERYNTRPCFAIRLAPNLGIPLISGLFRILWNAMQANAEPKPDLIYGRDPIALFLRPHRKVKCILELHQMPYTRIHRLIFKTFQSLVVISQGLKDDLLKKYTTRAPESILVAHDGASRPPKHLSSIKLQTDTPGENIGYTGSLQDGKGIQTILALAGKNPKMTFHVIGGNSKQVSDLKDNFNKKNIVFYGYKHHADIASYLNKFDVLIAPYRNQATIETGQDIARWISPLKLFEYMSAKKPILCSKLPVIEEILKDKHNARLVEPENIDEWSKVLKNLCNNKEQSAKLAKQAYDDFKGKHTWEKRAQKILQFCTEL